LGTEKKSLNALLDIITLVAAANNNGSYTEFILRGRPFIYITNNRGPRIDPWGTPCFSKVPQLKKKCLVVLSDFTLTFCLLLFK
jgi:hypothetical protein